MSNQNNPAKVTTGEPAQQDHHEQQQQDQQNAEEHHDDDSQRRAIVRQEMAKFFMDELYNTNAPVTTNRATTATPAVNSKTPATSLVPQVDCSVRKETDFKKEGDVVDKRFHVMGKLKEGGYGQIYKVRDLKTESIIAMKVEEIEDDTRPNVEAYVMAKFQRSPHCPRIYGAGTTGRCSYVVMQLLGKNLSELRRQCKMQPQRMSLSAAHRVMLECLQALQGLHKLGFVHRDLKPSNFAVGGDDCNRNTVFLLDFGLTRFFVQRSGAHRPCRDNVGFRGTVRYASVNVHENKEQSRRDDMWSVFYSHFELLVGELPWRKTNDEDAVLASKKRRTPEKLASLLPPEAADFVKEIRCLGFEDAPAYERIAEGLKKVLTRYGYKMEDPFDWQLPQCLALEHWDATCPSM